MCGICGLVYPDAGRPVDPVLLERMTDALRHRGPDGRGFYRDGGVGLGVRRLSLIDLETGDQPRACRILEAPAELNLARYRQTIAFTDVGPDGRLLSGDLRGRLDLAAGAEERVPVPPGFGRWHPFAQLQYLEMRVRLPNFITRSLDVTSMACGLEVRVPFLDHELVELCAGIPAALKMRGTQEKHILRRAMRHDLPAQIVRRRKRGLAAPYGQWLCDLPEFAAELLSARQVPARGYFDAAAVQEMLAEHRSGRVDYGKLLLGVLGVHVWDDLFVRDSSLAGP
ncbi:MAG: asparagine synthase C-terminal domain-containing protein [Candidatus Latescibacterota bacterium]